jgi:hypothetical protein
MKQKTHNENKEKKKNRKNDQTRLFKLKYELLKISANLQTEFAPEAHLAVGQWLEELNVEIFRMFRVGTLKPTASRIEGQDLIRIPRYWVRILTQTSPVLTEVFLGVLQSVHINFGTVSPLGCLKT